ncbi:dTDP-glucose 4,6-dehydratase [Methermicoccus shengliensis]|uniref:dTDP-glucose 4,6-dehydratase n=1 Tax=Methermicoccus shengliensis TaxID=660064 RepID=A0A832RX67_9EURY|nr:dTDP-glucose 4,6-dehydratase [Methermicoccus shengliensis]KUK04386.1 MAG: dTDP-glucose 4,6-dehydratase [Euryarchaeota archaeon 55_53]KUK30197.1 MAG: dTDP-glucose 4,6-dehydratase [Methanosarcinales archeaon 56_1174]MDI3488587.1 dTDP-glucose 4,6-dehydratase [Methanosarcinales archaeon]MDN5295757.1 dTDP-glucose 4,6-dehydratase [Methanosarcinales archaeon]HIH69036.1 dTDP-glucose 4,6-dehydratase [Methermicoccus shengliensis]
MKVLVTGGLGFIGSNFIGYILDKYSDIEVINVDALKYGSNPNNLRDVKNDERCSFVKGDISDYELMSKLVRDVDIVVNYAAESHVDRSISNPYSFLQSNVIGVFTILEAIRKNNPDAKLVHVGTDEVYGDIIKGSFKEEDRLKPSSPYSASKAAADMFVLAYVRTYGLHAMITRCTNNYGPYQFPEKLIPKTVIRASMNLKVPIYGTGKNVRDWIYVLDHCEAIDLVMREGEKGEIYNISSGEEKTNLEVVKTILDLIGKDESLIEFVEDRPGHDIRYSLDSSKIREELGWKPKHSFKEGIRKTVEWYLENEWWWKPLADEKVLHPTPWKLEW